MVLGTSGAASADTWYTVDDPIDPSYLTDLPFGTQSQWLQQWRAYLDTPPATALADGMGINFNVPPSQAYVTAKLLADSGIKRARVDLGWSGVSYADPNVLTNAASITEIISALRDNGIRPLILLSGQQGTPGPMLSFSATLTSSANAGATTVQLDPTTAAQIVPGYSGLDIGNQAAGVIFTAVDSSGVATLSRPLPTAMAAGTYPAATLRYQPFGQPELADGSPNPEFEATLEGWLSYVQLTVGLVASVYGSSDFDVEIWNELGNNSDFLDLGTYYDPLPVPTEGNTVQAILDATVSLLHDPANGWSTIQVGNGFTNQTAVDSGSMQPAGVDAIDKHPYVQRIWYPQGASSNPNVNAQGALDVTYINGVAQPAFVPTYTAFFPEFALTGINTATLIREIAPITTSTLSQFVGGTSSTPTPLGRFTGPADGSPPRLWVTEDNMNPNPINGWPDVLTPTDYAHIHAKAALRTYVSDIGKGVQAVDLFAVDGYPEWNLVDPDFFTAAQVGSSYAYPGTATGGPVMDAIRRLAATVAGAEPVASPRPLSLLGVATTSDAYQFDGDGTAAHPPLYDRDVLFFQPFQLTAHSWVAATYVMTRNIAQVYDESLPDTDPTRTDMPPETYRITFSGVDADDLAASATDPLTGADVPVDIVARSGDTATIQLGVTDSPRIVTLSENTSDGDVPAGLPSEGAGPPAAAPTSSGSGSSTPRALSRSHPTASGRASLMRSGHALYLHVMCQVRCLVRWSVRLQQGGRAQVTAGSRTVRAGATAAIRVAGLAGSPKRAGRLVATIVDVRSQRSKTMRLVIPRRLLGPQKSG